MQRQTYGYVPGRRTFANRHLIGTIILPGNFRGTRVRDENDNSDWLASTSFPSLETLLNAISVQ